MEKKAFRRGSAGLNYMRSTHPQAFFYRPDIGLHLPEISGIPRLNVFPHALDFFKSRVGGFSHCFEILANLRDRINIFPHRFKVISNV